MQTVTVFNSPLCGTLDLSKTPSKSIQHRVAVCSALSGRSEEYEAPVCDDVLCTINGMAALLSGKKRVFAGESASTLRFLMPLALALCGGAEFYGSPTLFSRPMINYLKDATTVKKTDAITVTGRLFPGKFELQGDISSQFLSGLLLALPLLNGDSEIVLTSPQESEAYVNMTVCVMREFGVYVEVSGGRLYKISGNQRYTQRATRYTEPDMSYAANFIVANKIGGNIALTNRPTHSIQGDAAIDELVNKDVVDMSQTPDLFPILAVNAAFRDKPTRFVNCRRLRFKECDRLRAVSDELQKLGVSVSVDGDVATVFPCDKLSGGVTVDARNDHRLVMAFTIAATRAAAPTAILGAECVKKSAPRFFEDIRALNGRFSQ